MRKLIVLGFVFVVQLAPVMAENEWAQEPGSYRGIPWGGSVEEASGKVERVRNCLCIRPQGGTGMCDLKPETNKERVPSERTCFSALSVGSVPVTDQLYFVDESFAGAAMTFPTSGFETLATIFTEKYGPPAKSQDEEITNRMGARFQNRTLTWSGERVTVSISRFGGKVTEGSAYFTTRELTAHREKARDLAKTKGKDAF